MTPHTAESSAAPRATPASPASSAAPRPAVIAQAGEGVSVRAFGNEVLFPLTAAQSGGTFTVGLATVPPGGRVPAHVQECEEELFLIVEGTYRFRVEGEWTDVGPGGLVYLPRGVAHAFQVVGDVPGKHWVLSTPGGFDRFYARCAEVFAAPGPPDVARLAAIDDEYGVRLV